MSSSHASRLRKLEDALRPAPEAAGIAWCMDRSNHKPAPCRVGHDCYAMDELPPDIDLVFHLIRDEAPERPASHARP